MSEKTSAIILAGGKGSRMGGVDKALLRADGVTFIERQRDVLRDVCDEVLIIGGSGEARIADRRADAGPLAGIEAGLHAAAHERVFVLACDYPDVTREIVALILRAHVAADACVPRIAGRAQPLYAVYRRAILPNVTRALDAQHLRVLDLLATLDVAYLDEPALRTADADLRAFLNVNTPDDYARLR